MIQRALCITMIAGPGVDRGVGGFVTAFPKRAGALVVMVVILHVVTPHHLHDFEQALRLVRRNQQMHMIGHQDIGVNVTWVLFAG